MSLPLFTRKAAVCWSLAVSCSTLLTAQTAYVPLGSEQPTAGLVPGEQAHPRLAINSAGGFLVWDDNAIDGNGFGIGAVALDTHLNAAQAPFRVNLDARGDQEQPGVALLNEGGAVFVWRGGQFGFQKVYARFLSPNNTWITGDVLVSSTNHPAKLAPAVTTLASGNVVIVWSTFGQRTTASMQDVYGQLFSPVGVKIGVPFAINQVTAYNQRTPAVAALPSGGFITAWISEQQRQAIFTSEDPFITSKGDVSVDVYARVYDDNANARGSEFLVNTNSVLCANPAIAATPDGHFMIAWSQGDPSNLTNSWDVYARPFSVLGIGGATVQVNTRLAGSQFGPQLACLNNDFLAVWTSERQDGSRDGVYGQFLTVDAGAVGPEFRVNTGTMLSQNQPTVAADNFGRFFAAWRTSQVENKLRVEISGQLYALPGFEPLALATNYAGPVLAGSPGGDGGTDGGDSTGGGTPVLDFPVAPATDGVILDDAFAAAKGTYCGLLYNRNGVQVSDSGYVTAGITASGRYTIKLRVGAKNYSFAGKLDADGRVTRETTRRGSSSPILLTLALDLTGADQLQGTFADGEVTAEFLTDRSVYNGSRNPYGTPGAYTVRIDPAIAENAVPAGYGYGTLKINKAGRTSFSAKLADGTVITQGSAVSKNGIWPLYAAPYRGQGRVLNWVQVGADEAAGKFVWIKPAGMTKVCPGGFSAEAQLNASRYSRPANGSRVLDLPQGNAQILLSGGGLGEPLSLPVYLDMNNRVVDSTGNGVKASVSLGNGSFQGSFIHPDTGKRVRFGGKLIQGDNAGAGFFLNNNLSGQVSFLIPLP